MQKQDLLTDVSERWLKAMRRGDFEAAWRQTDRIEKPRREQQKTDGFQRGSHHLLWNGESFHGSDILIRCQHGFGDAIQFLRYCPLVKALAKSVHVEVQPPLLSLLAGMKGIDRLIDGWNATIKAWHGVEIECMELAYAFRHTARTLPTAVPYLPVEQLLKTRPPLPLQWPQHPKVGLIWASSAWDEERSLSPADLEPLRFLHPISFFSLQQGDSASEAASLPFPITPLSSSTQDIADAAVALLSMDLVITVDCMMAHLAGALGLPVWVLLKHEADWRWMTRRSDSPWYPTMRLFRQPAQGDWKPPILQLVHSVSNFLSQQPKPDAFTKD